MVKQFENVNCSRGAPMGRASFGTLSEASDCSLKVFRVTLNTGGYDDGGAYWGLPQDNLYCIESINMSDYYRTFVRARDRAEAAALAEVGSKQLRKKLKLDGSCIQYTVKAIDGKLFGVPMPNPLRAHHVSPNPTLGGFDTYYEAVDSILEWWRENRKRYI